MNKQVDIGQSFSGLCQGCELVLIWLLYINPLFRHGLLQTVCPAQCEFQYMTEVLRGLHIKKMVAV